MTETEKREIIRQLEYDAGRLDALSFYATDRADNNVATMTLMLAGRLQDTASYLEAHLKTESFETCSDIGDRGNFRCSACLVEWQDAENHDFRFCPSCGMRVRENA